VRRACGGATGSDNLRLNTWGAAAAARSAGGDERRPRLEPVGPLPTG
jgi:hypothetical protein